MQPGTLLGLPWLAAPPGTQREEIRALKRSLAAVDGVEDLWRRLTRLAAYGLDEVQLSQLSRLISALPDGPGAPPRLKLALLGGGTLSLCGPAIVASALRWDLRVDVIEGGYGSAVTDALDPGSAVRRAEPDMALVAFDRRTLGLDRARLTAGEAEAAVESALATVRSVVEGLRPSVT